MISPTHGTDHAARFGTREGGLRHRTGGFKHTATTAGSKLRSQPDAASRAKSFIYFDAYYTIFSPCRLMKSAAKASCQGYMRLVAMHLFSIHYLFTLPARHIIRRRASPRDEEARHAIGARHGTSLFISLLDK